MRSNSRLLDVDIAIESMDHPMCRTAVVAAIWSRGEDLIQQCRKPEIVADAAHVILTRGLDVTGNFFIDEHVLREEGLRDCSSYSCVPGAPLRRNLYLEA